MSIQFEKTLDANKIFENIQKEIGKERFNFDLWKKVEAILKKFDGKQINKRIEIALKVALPDNAIYYDNNYGMFHVRIWGNGIDYNDSKSYLLGYADNPILDMVKVLEHNQCWELEEGRANKKMSITLEDIENQVKVWNEGLTKMQSVYNWAGQYGINYMSYGFDLNLR
jgi:hypothetical protein